MPQGISSQVWGLNLNGAGFVLNWLDDLKQEPAEVVWVVGSDVEYAVHLEFGHGNPPYPFLYPAAVDVMANEAEAVIDNSEDLEEVMETLAEKVKKQAKINATAGRSDRSPGTDPDHPKVVTGNLRSSITAERIK